MSTFNICFLIMIMIWLVIGIASEIICARTIVAPATSSDDGPYRTAVPVALTPEPIKQPKPKRAFKMPDIKISNSMKTFLMILPVCICAIVIGILHDMDFPSTGIRVGMGFATGFIGVYFIALIIKHLDHCS